MTTKLTDAQRKALVYASNNETVYIGRYGEVDGKTIKALVKRDLMKPAYTWDSGMYCITHAGLAVLDATLPANERDYWPECDTEETIIAGKWKRNYLAAGDEYVVLAGAKHEHIPDGSIVKLTAITNMQAMLTRSVFVKYDGHNYPIELSKLRKVQS